MNATLSGVYKIALENHFEILLPLLSKQDPSFKMEARIVPVAERIKELVRLRILNKTFLHALDAIEENLEKNPYFKEQRDEKIYRVILADFNRGSLLLKIVAKNRLSEKFPALFQEDVSQLDDTDIPEIDEETKTLVHLNRLNKVLYKWVNEPFDKLAVKAIDCFNEVCMESGALETMIPYVNERPFLVFWKEVGERRRREMENATFTFSEESLPIVRIDKNKIENGIIHEYPLAEKPLPGNALASMPVKRQMSAPITKDQVINLYLNYCHIFSWEIDFDLLEKLGVCRNPNVLHGYMKCCIDMHVKIDLKNIEKVDHSEHNTSSNEAEDEPLPSLDEIRAELGGKEKSTVEGDDPDQRRFEDGPKPENLKTFEIFVQFLGGISNNEKERAQFRQLNNEYQAAKEGKPIQPLLKNILAAYQHVCIEKGISIPKEEIDELEAQQLTSFKNADQLTEEYIQNTITEQLASMYLNYCEQRATDIDMELLQALSDCVNPIATKKYLELCIRSGAEIELKVLKDNDHNAKMTFLEASSALIKSCENAGSNELANELSEVLRNKNIESPFFSKLVSVYLLYFPKKTMEHIYKELEIDDKKSPIERNDASEEPKPEDLKSFEHFLNFLGSLAKTDDDKAQYQQLMNEIKIANGMPSDLLEDTLNDYTETCREHNISIDMEAFRKLTEKKDRDRTSSPDEPLKGESISPLRRIPLTPAQLVDAYIEECISKGKDIDINRITELSGAVP